jgi:hypothetical protein
MTAKHAIHHCMRCNAIVLQCRCPGPHPHLYDSTCQHCRKDVMRPIAWTRPPAPSNPCIVLGED